MTAACPACAVLPVEAPLAEEKNAVQLSVPGIRCAACISAIEDRLNGLAAVESARVNLGQRRVSIVTEQPVSELVGVLKSIGYDAFPLNSRALEGDADPVGRDLLMRLGVAGFAMMNVMLLSVAVWSGAEGSTRDLFHLISATIALPTVLFSAQPFFRNAWVALRSWRLNMDVPISLAILLAAAMSLYETLNGGEHAYFDAALSLTFFLLIGRYLEHHTRSTARSAAKELAALEVHTAERKTGTGFQTVPVEELGAGDTVLVPTGVRIPVDGVLLAGEAQTDRSFLTGESDPVMHSRGASLNAGEVNLGAPLELQATAVGQDTRLQQIARLVETAENARNRYTTLADRAARFYAPAVHILGLATFLGWFLLTRDVRLALNISISVLIITCPCALGLAVPAVSTAAVSKLYQLGFLVKSGSALERLAEVKTVVFDKTGTLTVPGFSFDLGSFTAIELGIAKALAQSSGHPLSKALGQHLRDVKPIDLQNLQEFRSKGVSAMFGVTPVALGKADWFGREGQGLFLQVGDAVRDFPYHETQRDGVREMSQGLHQVGCALEVLSGDTKVKTSKLAERSGIDTFFAEMTPEEKCTHVADLNAQGRLPCMVGDGLNDTIALAEAHASIAPGSALDAARNAADVVIVNDTLKQVPKLFLIARKAAALSRQNFGIAFAYNAVAIPIAVSGHASPLAAALAMSLSSITVILNASRVGWGQ